MTTEKTDQINSRLKVIQGTWFLTDSYQVRNIIDFQKRYLLFLLSISSRYWMLFAKIYNIISNFLSISQILVIFQLVIIST